ncbi:carbohydrate-binding module family 52 protein [Annulohypoxylon maeteangense]|uniref:carbohydrate-binding module family 52 protein n=1 Tax=Annulohypoxylon maeteangense TaxID=1927788 RepID=UPI002008EA94|nr:carbohydrate-binding module family 52 protein [Annulohypoxylon maeteangense]KAI0886689.1 carbohydrate-binding module family 52 protein [Annulohypoxylon maeteangense]
MSTRQYPGLLKVPIVGSIFQQASNNRRTRDDDRALLEDDPLSIQLETIEPTPRSAPGRPAIAAWNRHYNDSRRNRSCQLIIFVTILAGLLLAILLPRKHPSTPIINDDLLPCGNSRYSINDHTCYQGNSLCPVIDKKRTLKCGNDCYLPHDFSCNNRKLVQVQTPDSGGKPPAQDTNREACTPNYLHLSDPPYENYFISDCSSASHVVITSPLANSDPKIINPRLLIAWPAGNSGIVAYFSPVNGLNGTLGIGLENIARTNRTLNPLVGGVTGVLTLNSSAILDLAILGSIRTIREFIEGPSTLSPKIQDAIKTQQLPDGGIQLNRQWLDKTTETFLTFHSLNQTSISIQDGHPHFQNGSYIFNAWSNYPQLDQLGTMDVINSASKSLISQNEEDVKSLTFLSYSTKLLAGAWRFLTYFGRDSLISLLLLQPILSEGDGGAVEAILEAAVERINAKDGTVCHEETIGDYASILNEQQGIDSTDPSCDYKMIDTDFFLLIAMNEYFVNSAIGRTRRDIFFARKASVLPGNRGLGYENLILATAEKIMKLTAGFEQSPVKENLIHLNKGQAVGQWRDSGNGLGGGRIPYDVNTALVPAALRSIASLSNNGFFPSHVDWETVAGKRAVVWEDNTLSFFQVNITAEKAQGLIKDYIKVSGFPGDVKFSDLNSPVVFHGLALDGKSREPIVRVMNTDDCFRLFLLNGTDQTQLSAFLSQVADNILRPFPLGLSTAVGLVVSNPAYGEGSVDVREFAETAYHGTVVWGWQLAMMAAGLEKQLGRCEFEKLAFCTSTVLHGRVLEAYNHLWDLIDANREHLSSEVWSWTYQDGSFHYTPMGALSPPEGQSPVESDIRQLWSLTFLAVKRNNAYSRVS